MAEENTQEQNTEDQTLPEDRGDEVTASEQDKTGNPKEASSATEQEEESGNQDSNLMVPKHRFDSATSRARNAERENQQLKQQLAELQRGSTSKEPSLTIDGLHDQIAQLDLQAAQAGADGDFKKQAELMGQARNIERNINRLLTEDATSNISSEAMQKVELMNTIKAIEARIPALDNGSEHYDADLTAEVLEVYESFALNRSLGMTPAEAMQRAVGLVVREVPVSDPNKIRKTNTAKNVRDAGRIPPNMNKAGVDSDKSGDGSTGLNIASMSEEEFDALPESKKAQMRGDLFA